MLFWVSGYLQGVDVRYFACLESLQTPEIRYFEPLEGLQGVKIGNFDSLEGSQDVDLRYFRGFPRKLEEMGIIRAV